MNAAKLTKQLQVVIRNIAAEADYEIVDNKRFVLSHQPVLYYQPDFVLLKRSALVVIEVELSTDARKAITGDIVRAGLIGAYLFIGIAKNVETANAIEKYGEALRKRIREISRLRVIGISAHSQGGLVRELKALLRRGI